MPRPGAVPQLPIKRNGHSCSLKSLRIPRLDACKCAKLSKWHVQLWNMWLPKRTLSYSNRSWEALLEIKRSAKLKWYNPDVIATGSCASAYQVTHQSPTTRESRCSRGSAFKHFCFGCFEREIKFVRYPGVWNMHRAAVVQDHTPVRCSSISIWTTIVMV